MKRTGSGSGPRQDGCTCGELVPEHLPDCPVVPFAAALLSPETTPAGVLDEAALDVDRQRAFVNWVRLWWSGPNGFAVVPAGNDEVVAEDFEDMERELAALGISLATFRAAALGRSGSGGGRG